MKGLVFVILLLASPFAAAADSPPAGRIQSPGRTSYYVDPAAGDDARSGLAPQQAWRSFAPVNARLLAPGDRIEILAPGAFHQSLIPMGAGTAADPIEIRFAPGQYDFHPDDAIALKLHISNTNDAPQKPKSIAWLFRNIKHLKITGNQSDIFVHGKMIEIMFDHAENVTLSGLSFDYRRPLVSEFTILDVAADHADVQVHADSTYAIENGKLVWIGEGWRSAGTSLNQEYDPADDGRTWRRGNGPLTGVTRVEQLQPFKLRLFFKTNPGLNSGRVIQFRETFRDCAGGFVLRSKDIAFKDLSFHALGGMGIVHQFSENLTYDHVNVAPRPGSGRTSCAWADMLHFSGCKGQILIDTVKFSGSHDDPVNVHGTHLRVIDRPAPNQILVRFMHGQTYGFDAFAPGDEIEFVSHVNLRSYAAGKVVAAEMKSDKDILLTLETAAPENIPAKDVIENITWTPAVTIRNCQVSSDSCRGFLLTTRRPILVENNTFLKTTMSAIDIADDANSWFESGPVRDVTIRNNRFIHCGAPVIRIWPETHAVNPAEPVHANIRILENYFDLKGGAAIAARSVKGLLIKDNRCANPAFPIQQTACTDVQQDNNRTSAPR